MPDDDAHESPDCGPGTPPTGAASRTAPCGTAALALPAARSRALRWLWAGEALALLWLAATRVTGYERFVDLHLWDELAYLWDGRDLLGAGVWPGLADSPLYSVAYGLLALLPVRGHVPDLMFLACAAGAPLALWWALRACVPAPLALLAGVWLATSPVVLESTTIGGYPIPHVYTFHAFLVAIAVGCVARGRVAAGALVLAAAVTDRAEFAPWFLCFAILASAASPLRAHRSMALVLAGLALVLLAVPLLHAGHRERSWLAFRQHYARGAVYQDLLREWAEGGGSLDPQRVQTAARDLEAAFTHPDERVQRDFPGAASLADALRIDPARLLGHVERNLCMLPASLSVTLSSTLLPPALPWWSLAALGGCVAAGWWRRRHAAGPSGSDPRRLLPVFLLTSPAALLVPLVVWSRPELALPVFPLAAWIVCGGACGLLPSGERWRRRLALAGPALVLGIAWLVPGPFTGPAPALQHRDSLELLRRCLPPGEVRLLSTWTAFQLRLLERPGIAAVTLGAPGDRTFAQVLAEERVDHVLRTPQLELQASGLKDLATTLEGNGWREVARQNAVRLYAREERGR